MFGFSVLRRDVRARHPEVHIVGKEDVPRGVFKLAPLVTLDILDLATELLTKEKNLVIVEKLLDFRCKGKV
jgi:hypothetical protein